MPDATQDATIDPPGNSDRSTARTALAFVAVVLALQVVYAGVRFVDGGALLALARDGFSARIPPFGQYLFDSPLKVLLLWRGVPTHYLAIALVFAATVLLPLLALRLCFRDGWPGAWLLFALTPCFKMLCQNVGIGDGVTLALALAAVFAGGTAVALGAATLLPLWHFEQGALVLMLAALFLWLRDAGGDRRRAGVLAGGLAAGALLFLAYKLTFAPPAASRVDWIVQRGLPLLARNALALPIILASLASLSFPLVVHGDAVGTRSLRRACAGLLAAALGVSLVVNDASRVLLILGLPVVFLALEGEIRSGAFARDLHARPLLYAALAFACVLVPLYSWSGVDLYLWKDLLVDIQKYL